MRFGFKDLGLHRIHANVIAENAASLRLVQKLGVRQEGRLRENVRIHGRWCDTLLYGILESEWTAETP